MGGRLAFTTSDWRPDPDWLAPRTVLPFSERPIIDQRTTPMKTTFHIAATLVLILAGASFAQPGGPASTNKPAPGNPGSVGQSLQLEAVKPYSNIEKSQLREKCLELLQGFARSDNALMRANAIEGMSPAPARCETLVRAGLADDNLGVRYAAALTVGRLKLKNSAPMVRPLLSDADPSVRAAAVFAMVRTGNNVEQTELSSLLMNGDARARSNAAFILGELGNKSAVPMLRDAARQPMPPDSPIAVRLFRLQLAEALVKLGDKTASDTIEAALYPSSREDFEAAVLAAQIIGEVKIEKAAGQLVNLIEMQPGSAPKTADPRQAVYLQPPRTPPRRRRLDGEDGLLRRLVRRRHVRERTRARRPRPGRLRPGCRRPETNPQRLHQPSREDAERRKPPDPMLRRGVAAEGA